MLKSTSLLVFWYSYSLAVFVMCDVMPWHDVTHDTLVSFALLCV